MARQESEAAKAQMDAVFRCILDYCLTQQKVLTQRLPMPPPAASNLCMRRAYRVLLHQKCGGTPCLAALGHFRMQG